MTTTQGKMRRDSERLAFLVSRLNVIPGIMEEVADARIPEAQRRANLATLRDEFQAANNGVARLRRTLPLTKEAIERLQAAQKLANTLDGVIDLRMRVYAQADTAEIPLWTIGE